jgi:hypothetical protein
MHKNFEKHQENMTALKMSKVSLMGLEEMEIYEMTNEEYIIIFLKKFWNTHKMDKKLNEI